MRIVRGSGFLLLALLVFLHVPVVATGGEGEAHPAAQVARSALEALKLRMEARIKEGELLSKAGRLEEALEAYRSTGRLYEEGMRDVRALLAQLGAVESAAGTLPPAGAAAGPADGPRAPSKRRADVRDALAWLAAHQAPNGRWGAYDFADVCNGKPLPATAPHADGRGERDIHDVGTTGLALLAFLGAGYGPRGKHPYAAVVSKGLRYLSQVQDAEGCFGKRTSQQFMYSHGIASLAMLEAAAMTNSPIYRAWGQRALDFIAAARNPYMAWRYGVRSGENDTSVSVWMVMALKSAMVANRQDVSKGRPARFKVDAAAFEGARAWLDKATDQDYGRVGYIQRGTGSSRPMEMVDRFPGEKAEAMTAAGILMRVLMGEDPSKSDLIRKGVMLLDQRLPSWNEADGSIDMVYWYFGTLATFQVGGKEWQHWHAALTQALGTSQRRDTDACRVKGSWDPVGVWGAYGGRVASTAFMTLCLEVSLRYTRVFGAK